MDKHMDKQGRKNTLLRGNFDKNKWLSIRTGLLTATAIMLVISATMGSAWAFFTTYARAKGSVQIHLGHQEHITEDFDFTNFEKVINITSEADSRPVYLRARAFSAEYGVTYENNPSWTKVGDWMYYNKTLAPGTSLSDIKDSNNNTDELKVQIENVPKSSDPTLKDGDGFNVIVVYESTEVQYDGDVQLEAQNADWNRKVDTNRTSTDLGGGN